jgi:hypothetical protein
VRRAKPGRCSILAGSLVQFTKQSGGAGIGNRWSAYYLTEFVQQLFNGGGAGAAALAAAPTFFPNFTAQEPSLDSTNLQPPPTSPVNLPGPLVGDPSLAYPGNTDEVVDYNCSASSSSCPLLAQSELPCLKNNTVTANDGALQLHNNNGTDIDVSITGLGAGVGWQTDPADKSNYCDGENPADYLAALQFGTANGGNFIEASVGEATDTHCQENLAYTLSNLLQSVSTACVYN